MTPADVCDIAYALILERVEGDARAQFVSAGVAAAFGADGMEEYTPENARDRFEDRLTASEASSGPARPAGVSDEEWELRLALGVGINGQKAG